MNTIFSDRIRKLYGAIDKISEIICSLNPRTDKEAIRMLEEASKKIHEEVNDMCVSISANKGF